MVLETRKRGFTLMELMIAVVIIGILTVAAITYYGRYTCRSKQAVAHTALKNLQLAEERYRSRYGTYTVDINSLPGVHEYTSNPRYHLIIQSASDIAFTARAICNPADGCVLSDGQKVDEWQIDQDGNLTVIQNACQ